MKIKYKYNPNFLSIDTKLIENPRDSFFDLVTDNTMLAIGIIPYSIPLPNLLTTITFRKEITLFGEKYSQVQYIYDIRTKKCSPTFYSSDNKKQSLRSMEEEEFNRFLKIISMPKESLTDGELTERLRQESP